MEQLKKDIAKFHGGFENMLVSLHKTFLDSKSKIISDKIIKNSLQSGKTSLNELDRLIEQCLMCLSENQDLQDDLTQLLVSYRPRLENEINLIEDSIKTPAAYEDTNHNDEIDQMLQDAEADILRMVQEEKDKIEQIKNQQIKKQSENEYLESQRVFEQQQQMMEAMKNYEKQQQEFQKNSWLNEGELQSFLDMKKKNQTSNATNIDLNTDDNWCLPEEYNNNNNNNDDKKDESPKLPTNEEEEESTKNIENDQEIANRLLFKFLGLPTENLNNDNENEGNQNEVISNEEKNCKEKQFEENDDIKQTNEENQDQ